VGLIMSDAENVLAQVRALHKPYYEHNDKRIEHTVLVYCGDHAAPCDGTDDEPCAESKDGEHEAPACAECRCVTEDGEAGYYLWPCRTAKIIATLDGADV
jgi:hypothetical protein